MPETKRVSMEWWQKFFIDKGEDCTFCREVMARVFWDSQGILLISWQDNRPSKASLSFKTTRLINHKCLSPPQQHASTCHCCDNRNIGGIALGGTAILRL